MEQRKEEKTLNKPQVFSKKEQKQFAAEQKREEAPLKHHQQLQRSENHSPSAKAEFIPKQQELQHVSKQEHKNSSCSPIKRNLEERKDFKKEV